MKEEWLDIVDENDQVIGKAKKSDIYAKSLRHRIVHVLIFNDKGELALQLRSNKVNFCPNCWATSVGGHVQAGESCQHAAEREFEEELGLKTKLKFFSKDAYQAEGTPNKFLLTFKTNFNGPFKQDPEVVLKVKFFSLDKIKQMIKEGEKFHPELLFLLRKHF